MTSEQERARAELVGRVYEAANRRDHETLAALFPPGFRWYPDADEPDQDVRDTPEEAIAVLRDFAETFETFSTEVDSVTHLGEHLLVTVRHRGTLPGGGLVERPEAHLWSFSGEAPLCLREFSSPERARARAGESDRERSSE